MLALLYALYILGGRATYEELRIMLEHSSVNSIRDLVKRCEEDEQLVARSYGKGATIALTRKGVACVYGKLVDDRIAARMLANREEKKSAQK